MHPILQIIIGFFITDFLVGFFHWFEDTYLPYCTNIPILSDIAKDNELHHYFPRSMIAYSYWDNIVITTPLAILIVGSVYMFNKRLVTNYPWLVGTFLIFAILSNIIHRFSHMRDCENHIIVRSLQRIGIFASHKHHSTHHKDSNTKYCVISEYTNMLLDTIGFWKGLEYSIYLSTGIVPNKKLAYESYKEIHNHMHANAKLECPDTPTLEDVKILKMKLKEFKDC